MNITTAFILIVILLVSCSTKDKEYIVISDTEYGDELVLNSADTLGYHQWDDGSVKRPAGKYIKFYRNNGKIDTSFIWKGTTIVKPSIHNTKSDSKFLTVDQKPLDLIFGETDWSKNPPQRPFEPGNSRDMDRMFYKSPIHRYWIIVKNKKVVYGGYKKEKFIEMCDSLGVPDELRFN